MRNRRILLLSCLLTLALASSCGRSPDPTQLAPTAAAYLSPTAFQPGDLNASDLAASQQAVVATFTPFPTLSSQARLPDIPRIGTPDVQDAGAAAETNPLTGLLVADPQLLERRPLAIKISNYPREIRPQYGLNSADVVFEYYIEWLDTRFIAIFYGNNARQIGPVRSGRYFDEHVLRMYHAYYVFNYADPREFTYFLGGDMEKFLVVPGYGSCPPFFQYRVSPTISDVRHYESYFDSTRFGACPSGKRADNTRQPLRSGFFSDVVPADGATVDRIFTHYSKCDYNYWAYDPKTMRYLRFQEISPNQSRQHIDDCSDTPETYAPLMDALGNRQVAADNIVVIYVAHTFANENEQQDEIYHINLVDSGEAFVFRDGLGFPARWVRTEIGQPLFITTPSGDPIYLRPGRTFYEVIGETSRDWSDGYDWHFDFRTP